MSFISNQIKDSSEYHHLADQAADEIEVLEKQEGELRDRIKQLEQELFDAKQDQARYLKLTETGNFCPTKYSGLWGLHMSGRPYTKAELDAPIDAAIAAKESSK